MANLYGLNPQTTATSFPGDYDVREASITRKRALLDALRKQALTERGWGTAAGYILSRLLHGNQDEKLDTEEKALNEERRQATADWLGRMPRTKPGMPEMGPPTAEGEMQPPTPAKMPTREENMAWGTQGIGLGPLANEIGKASVANALAGPKLEIRDAYDKASGRRYKAWVDMTTGQEVGRLGGEEIDNKLHNTYDKEGNPVVGVFSNRGEQLGTQGGAGKLDIERRANYLKKTFGLDDQQAATLAADLIKTLPMPPGGAMHIANMTNLIGPPRGGGGGQATTPATPSVGAPSGAAGASGGGAQPAPGLGGGPTPLLQGPGTVSPTTQSTLDGKPVFNNSLHGPVVFENGKQVPYTGQLLNAGDSKGVQDVQNITNASRMAREMAVQAEKNPQVFSTRAGLGSAASAAMGGFGREMLTGLTPEQQQLRGLVGRNFAEETHRLYGAQLTTNEIRRGNSFTIQELDNAGTVAAKLRGAADFNDEMAKKYGPKVQEAAKARAAGGAKGWGKAIAE